MTQDSAELDRQFMSRALALARQGEGFVEPNPMVGCVLVRDGQILGEGWHRRYGGPHAEVEAIRAAEAPVQGATAYVTLEPCSHVGKTPPCTRALLEAGIRRVVVALEDPFPLVAGRGVQQLREQGVLVEVGLLAEETRQLCAPYLKFVQQGRPWTIAKWAMTLDGKIATRTGDSQWISNEQSRAIVHQLRGRVDAILVGSRTALRDDPLLTARPAGPRTPSRVVLDSLASLSSESRLVQTAREIPVLVVVGPQADPRETQRLTSAGCELLVCTADEPSERIGQLLDELGRRRMTNVLFEGGSQIFGALLDSGHLDEVHCFIAPILVGGRAAPPAFAGFGVASIQEALRLGDIRVETVGSDLYVRGRVERED